jgi:hypothetical protein
VLFASANIFGGVFTFTAQVIVERNLSHDKAVRMMAIVIAATAAVAAFVQWTTQVFWVTIAAGSTASFFVGAFIYSRAIEDYFPLDRGGPVAPIGTARGSLISAIVTLGGLALVALVLWTAGRAP